MRLLDENCFWKIGTVGLSVKAIRTQPAESTTKHLRNSLQMLLRLVELSSPLDRRAVGEIVAARENKELDWLILSHLMTRG